MGVWPALVGFGPFGNLSLYVCVLFDKTSECVCILSNKLSSLLYNSPQRSLICVSKGLYHGSNTYWTCIGPIRGPWHPWGATKSKHC